MMRRSDFHDDAHRTINQQDKYVLTAARYKAVYEVSGLPLILFQYPDATKATYDLETQLEIAALPGVFAMKNGVRNMKRWDTEIPVIRKERPNLQILTCHDEYLLHTMFVSMVRWSATAA